MQRCGEDGEQLIAAFLRANPGWLAAHPELYAVLEPPRRHHGEALADHMAAMLTVARRQGDDTAAGRRAAEGFMRRVQDAVLALMRGPDPVWCLLHDLPGLLQVESLKLWAEWRRSGVSPLPCGAVDAVLGQKVAVVREATTGWHGEAGPLAQREALIRVPAASGAALVAIASRDPAGFEGATTQALAFFGQAVAAALERA